MTGRTVCRRSRNPGKTATLACAEVSALPYLGDLGSISGEFNIPVVHSGCQADSLHSLGVTHVHHPLIVYKTLGKPAKVQVGGAGRRSGVVHRDWSGQGQVGQAAEVDGPVIEH